MCTKHADVARVHRDHETFTATRGPLIQDTPMFDVHPAIVSLDPPDHTIRRRVITRAFTPRARRSWRVGFGIGPKTPGRRVVGVRWR